MSGALAEADVQRLFKELCEPFRADLYRFLFWLCHDRALAEDVMQETLLRAWRCFDSLADRKAVKPWLLTIARRELARVFERKRPETVEIDELTEAERQRSPSGTRRTWRTCGARSRSSSRAIASR